MKKLFFVAAMMFGFVSFSNAQQVSTSSSKKKAGKEVTSQTAKPVVAMQSAKKVEPAPKAKELAVAKPSTSAGVVLKKDGTPDKRYNNVAGKNKGPLKKDGTPDMRYNKNKKG